MSTLRNYIRCKWYFCARWLDYSILFYCDHMVPIVSRAGLQSRTEVYWFNKVIKYHGVTPRLSIQQANFENLMFFFSCKSICNEVGDFASPQLIAQWLETEPVGKAVRQRGSCPCRLRRVEPRGGDNSADACSKVQAARSLLPLCIDIPTLAFIFVALPFFYMKVHSLIHASGILVFFSTLCLRRI